MYQKTEGNSEANIIRRLRENKEVDFELNLEDEELEVEDELEERTHTVGDTQYWKRGGKFYSWTESGGRKEVSEDEYKKALDGGSTSGASKSANPKRTQSNSYSPPKNFIDAAKSINPIEPSSYKDLSNALFKELGVGEGSPQHNGPYFEGGELSDETEYYLDNTMQKLGFRKESGKDYSWDNKDEKQSVYTTTVSGKPFAVTVYQDKHSGDKPYITAGYSRDEMSGMQFYKPPSEDEKHPISNIEVGSYINHKDFGGKVKVTKLHKDNPEYNKRFGLAGFRVEGSDGNEYDIWLDTEPLRKRDMVGRSLDKITLDEKPVPKKESKKY